MLLGFCKRAAAAISLPLGDLFSTRGSFSKVVSRASLIDVATPISHYELVDFIAGSPRGYLDFAIGHRLASYVRPARARLKHFQLEASVLAVKVQAGSLRRGKVRIWQGRPAPTAWLRSFEAAVVQRRLGLADESYDGGRGFGDVVGVQSIPVVRQMRLGLGNFVRQVYAPKPVKLVGPMARGPWNLEAQCPNHSGWVFFGPPWLDWFLGLLMELIMVKIWDPRGGYIWDPGG